MIAPAIMNGLFLAFTAVSECHSSKDSTGIYAYPESLRISLLLRNRGIPGCISLLQVLLYIIVT